MNEVHYYQGAAELVIIMKQEDTTSSLCYFSLNMISFITFDANNISTYFILPIKFLKSYFTVVF